MPREIKHFCSDCVKEKAKWPLLKMPGSSYCYDHRKERQRNYQRRRRGELEEFRNNHNEYGEAHSERDEFGWYPSDYEREAQRIDEKYGPPPRKFGEAP